jgi:hypothetical protein
MDDFTITDFDDRPMTVGTTVRMWWDGTDAQAGDGQFGIVLDLGEWEGDYDDEGRPIGIAPRVEVLWEDGTTASFVTSEWEYDGSYFERIAESGKVEELDVVHGPLRPPVLRPAVGVGT